MAGRACVLELRSIDQQLRIEREERSLEQAVANRELIRNLAHEIKNPLGGLRGAAQLLERELERAELREYTQVIIKEADRLQLLMDRLLTPHRPPHLGPLNIHEVCERVRSLVRAEFPAGVRIVRDYDTSLPEIEGDREQLIQAVLNIARNAAQACTGARSRATAAGEIVLRTRIARQVTIARQRHRLALELQVIDDGPGVPPEMRERDLLSARFGPRRRHGLGALARADLRAAPPRRHRVREPAGADRIHDPAAANAQTANRRLTSVRGVCPLASCKLKTGWCPMNPVWIIDDDRSIRWVFEKALGARGHRRSARSARRRTR